MAISPDYAKKLYENMSLEELEANYEELKGHFCFDSKEEQIGYIINNRLNASLRTNINSKKLALEELLKEKTGKEYTIEPKRYDITLTDIINYVTIPNKDPFWTMALNNFFNELSDISDDEKKSFLVDLVQNKDIYNEFTREITKPENVKEVYDKYKKLAQDYVIRNSRKG